MDPLLAARLRLALTSGLGPILTQRLSEMCDHDPLAMVSLSCAELREVQGIGRTKAEKLFRQLQEADVEAEWAMIQRHQVTLVPLEDPNYPPLLRHIPDPPPLLFVRGELRPTDSISLGIVGARKCSHYGYEQAGRMARLCSESGLVITSGGARGIDTSAHQATLLANGRTVAVLGCGLGHCYPAENAELFGQIARGGGAVISELPMKSPPIAEHFPRRNRIISGMSLGVLVIEADHRSGALITARLAVEEHGREVMALPGRVDSRASNGCHRIIREGWATLVTNSHDVLDALNEAGDTLKSLIKQHLPPEGQTPIENERAPSNLPADSQPPITSNPEPAPAPTATSPSSDNVLAHFTPSQQTIYDTLDQSTISFDQLAERTNLPMATLQADLMMMQLNGWVKQLPGHRIQRGR